MPASFGPDTGKNRRPGRWAGRFRLVASWHGIFKYANIRLPAERRRRGQRAPTTEFSRLNRLVQYLSFKISVLRILFV